MMFEELFHSYLRCQRLAKTPCIPPSKASSECIYPGFPPICAFAQNPPKAVLLHISGDFIISHPPSGFFIIAS
jgi:hypothetical protein